MKNIGKYFNKTYDVAIIGSGMGSLTAACLLAKDGYKVLILERNYLPGGCTSSYYRKGFIFEAGATTLVGLDDDMPLKYLLDQTGITLDATLLDIPMKVYLKSGKILTRHQDLDDWIREAERHFGKKNQRAFWEYCFKVSQFVWQTSLKQHAFPPTKVKDLLPILKNFEFQQLQFATTAFTSMQSLLKKHDLLDNKEFIDFINEQLLITAQNTIEEVNVLFGCTALCYTNFGNYYIKGGLINLVNPLIEYIENQGGKVLTRVGVSHIFKNNGTYELALDRKGEGHQVNAKYVVSGIPINNTLDIYKSPKLEKKYNHSVMPSEKLVSAFSMGIGFESDQIFDCLHHQIHLQKSLIHCDSNSIFLSLNHPSDDTRTPKSNQYVANISTHIHHPADNAHFDKAAVEQEIIDTLVHHGFFNKEDIVYTHSSTPASWESWTSRKYGFVGGYPQYLDIKPWQMLDARLDGERAYICGDTTYPGQGIPGVTLSGIIAYHKMKIDGLQ